eukprot:4490221-Prymnesium_polylepis.1
MEIETAGPAEALAAAQGYLELDDDDAFDVDTRSHTRSGASSPCWGLATEESQRSCTLSAKEQWRVKAYNALKYIGELPELTEGGGGGEGEQGDGAATEGGNDGEEGDGATNGEEEGARADPAAKLLFKWL